MRPIAFTRFCEVVGLKLRPGQLAYAKVAYDGLDPRQLEGAERDLARQIFGNVDTVPSIARAVAVQAKGRDVGGTRMAATRLVHLGATCNLSRLGASEVAYCLIVAPKLKLANAALRFALDAARKLAEEFDVSIEDETADGFTLVRGDGRRVRFEPFAASRGGDSARGIPIIGALLEEAAFFFDEHTGVVNDRSIFNAIVPRLLLGGQIMIVSSPWGKSGLLAEEFDTNFGNPTTALAAHCPTLVMRDEPEIVEMVARESARSPENARRELGAEFITGDTAAFPDADSAFVKREGRYHWSEPFCVCDPAESLDAFTIFCGRWGDPDQRRVQAMDRGCLATRIVDDPVAGPIVVPVFEPVADRRLLRISDLACWRGPDVKRLGMGIVANEIAAFAKRNGARQLISDQRGAAYLSALAEDRGLKFRSFNIGPTNKHECVTLIRTFLRDGQISVTTTNQHSGEFKAQLRNYKRTPRSGGGFTYSGGTRSAVDDWPAGLVTLGASLLAEETGTPADQTRFAIKGSPTNKGPGKRHEIPQR